MFEAHFARSLESFEAVVEDVFEWELRVEVPEEVDVFLCACHFML